MLCKPSVVPGGTFTNGLLFVALLFTSTKVTQKFMTRSINSDMYRATSVYKI